MRYTSRHYARALLEALHAPNAKTDRVIDRFVDVLARDRRLHDAPRILRAFRHEWNRSDGTMDVTVSTARPVTKAFAREIEGSLRAALGARTLAVAFHEDPALLGGARIQWGDTIVDGSMVRTLASLKTALIRST